MGGVIMIGLIFKLGYDIGYFDAQSLKNDKNAELPITQPVLTMESAQRIVSGALKEDPTNPKTIVDQIIDNNHKLSTIIIENNKQKKIAWIINMRLFFTDDLFNDEGYNLTEGIEHEHNINRGDHWLLVTGLAGAFEHKLIAVYVNSENRSGIGRAELSVSGRPIAASEIKRYIVSKYKFGWRVWIEVKLADKITLGI